ncbi:MAG TPA: CHASE3 domain-containing protein [Longimicrobium sp.]|nr:CHASE3 domain-containing protein [Longimicrobium sp.]
MMESTRFFRRWRAVAVLAPPLIVLLFVLALVDSLDRRRDSTQWVQHTYRVIGHLDAVYARLVDAETGQRGYIITGDTAYLAPYRHADAQTHALLATLRRETRDNAAQQAALGTLDSLARHRLHGLQDRIDIVDREGFAAARTALIAGGGRETMEQIRRVLARMNVEEERLLVIREREQERLGRQVMWTLLIGAAIVGASAIVTNTLFVRHARALEAVNGELHEANALLQEQAAELETQADELQIQTEQLQELTTELEMGNEELQQHRSELESLAAELSKANDELESANHALEQRTLEAEAANRAKSDFLSAMSHELRTPLNAVAGYVDLMELGIHGPLTPAQRTSLERIRYNEQHLLTLITDILNFARIEAGRIEMHTADVPVAELLVEIAGVVEPLAAARELALSVDACAASVHVRGDRDRIAQILLNLLSNAVKCTDAGGEIHVSCDSDAAGVQVHVRDTGRGIEPERHRAIFEPFVQLAPERTLAQGVGLGLSISRELARAMDGEITVESAPGKGSTFTLTLPAARRVSMDRIVHEPDSASPASKPRTHA